PLSPYTTRFRPDDGAKVAAMLECLRQRRAHGGRRGRRHAAKDMQEGEFALTGHERVERVGEVLARHVRSASRERKRITFLEVDGAYAGRERDRKARVGNRVGAGRNERHLAKSCAAVERELELSRLEV